MKKYSVYIFLLIVSIGCKHPSKDASFYFGGEIINPKSNWVLLMKNEQVIDTLPLSKAHTFGKRFTGLDSGLYYFKHGYEFQYVFLEPGDSLYLRLNTWDFDETLVFDGEGADKNELLIRLFLANEQENTNFYSYFSLDEAAFEEKINDLFTRHHNLLDKLQESNHNLSDAFLHLAQGVIQYPIYRLKELYPYYHNKSLDTTGFVPSDHFYSFRKDKIDLNDSKLSGYYAYQNYIESYLYNIAYQENNNTALNDNFRNNLLKLITTKIQLPDLKNRLLYQEINYMLFHESCTLDSNNLKIFYTNSTDSTAIHCVKQLLKDKAILPNNSFFPDFKLLSIYGDTIPIQKLINHKKSVVYFWSSNFSSNDFLRKRIAYLSKKYPDLFFLGINISSDFNTASNFAGKMKNQYSLPKNSMGKKLVSSEYPRAILIDTDGKVINNFTLLSQSRIEKQLQQLLEK